MSDLINYAWVSTIEQTRKLQTDALDSAGCAGSSLTLHLAPTRPAPARRALGPPAPGDTLAVWRLDRLGRSLPQLLTLIADLEPRQIAFRPLTEAIDTTTAGGRLVFSIFGTIAAFEAQLVSERTKAGLAAANARERTPGRAAAMSEKRLNVAREMHADGHSMGSIASTLRMGRSTLYRHLSPRELTERDHE